VTAPAPQRNRPYADRLVPAPLPVGLVLGAALVATVLAGATAAAHPAAPLVLAAAGAGVAAVWQRPLVAAVCVVALVPALSGLERGLGVPFLKLSEALLLLSLVVVVLRRPQLGQRFRAADWGLLAFALAGAVFAAVHVLAGTSDPGTFVRVGLQPTMLFMTWWVASRSTRHAADLRVVLRWMLVVSVVPAGLSVLQAFDAPGARSLLLSLTGSPLLAEPGQAGVVRVTGPFPIWHSLAAYVLPAFAVGVLLLLRRDLRVLRPLVLVPVLLVDAAALVLSVTITVIGWAVVAVLLLAFLQKRLAQAVALVTLAGVVSSVLFAAPLAARIQAQVAPESTTSTEVPQTIAYRIGVWQRDFLPLLERAVPYGVGNELPQSVLFQNTENQYISLTLRGGVLLLLAGIAAVVCVAAAVAGAARRPRELPGAAAGAALGVVLFLPVASMIWPYLTNAGFPQAWLSLAGAVVGAAAGRTGTR
jgi:hypothetical protein